MTPRTMWKHRPDYADILPRKAWSAVVLFRCKQSGAASGVNPGAVRTHLSPSARERQKRYTSNNNTSQAHIQVLTTSYITPCYCVCDTAAPVLV